MSNWERQIEDDLRWREAELGSLKLLIASTPEASDRYRSLLRAAWAMLYAHYEGFCKFCWDLLLSEVEQKGVKRSELTDGFAKLSLDESFRVLRKNISNDGLWNFFRADLEKLLEGRANQFPRLETRSNLWPSVSKENNLKVELVCSRLDEHETRLKSIVARRNEIAHGKKMVIKSLADYQPYEDSALIVMHELAIAVVDCLNGNKFVRPEPASSVELESLE